MSNSPSAASTASTDSALPTPVLDLGEMDAETEAEAYGKPDIFSPTLSSDDPISDLPLLSTLSRSRSTTRAPVPPPILVRQPTDYARTAKGLNINLNSPVHHGDEEELDHVPDLIPSPRRAAFGTRLRIDEGIPMSPAWQAFDSPTTASSSRPPTSVSLGQSLVPPSPLLAHYPNTRHSPVMQSPASKRFDPTPNHGIHARNMSLFFPQPGAGEAGLGFGGEQTEEAGEQIIPSQTGRKPFGGQGEWSFGASARAGDGGLASPRAKSKRRGHHHKHSLSHNFFSFLDPTLTNPALAPSTSTPSIPHTLKTPDTPQSVPMPSTHMLSVHSPSLSPLPRGSDPMSQLLASFACLELLIGAALWVEGQMGGWRCLAGVGYLVVFDAFGVGVGVVARGGDGWRSVRRPYGTTRFLSLLYFSQSLFLVFASVYIAKESIEQVVLGASGNEHGGHGHSHGHADLDGEERPFPTFLLLCATLASAVGGGIMHTHAKLVDAVGSLFLSRKYLSSPIVKRFPHLLANPFSVTVMGSSAVVLVGTLIVPLSSLHTFDALAALTLTILTTALSLPSSKAFGQVLLQTAPLASTSQMKNLQRAIKDITADHRIRSITHTRCWAITAGSAPPSPQDMTPPITPRHTHSHSSTPAPTAWHSPSSSPTVGEFGGIHPSQYPSLLNSESDAPLVITMEVEVDEDLGDRDVLDVTRVLWGKLCKVCKGGSKGRVGEVSVGVKRVKRAG